SRQQRSIHRPITFLSRRDVPFTPPSLLKFICSASGEVTGASTSIPTSDHVPELINAVPSRAAIAATADPVSCVAGAITGVSATLAAPTLARSRPTTVPGSTIGAGSEDGRPTRSSSPESHVRVVALTICVVLALVNSQTAFPVIQ